MQRTGYVIWGWNYEDPPDENHIPKHQKHGSVLLTLLPPPANLAFRQKTAKTMGLIQDYILMYREGKGYLCHLTTSP